MHYLVFLKNRTRSALFKIKYQFFYYAALMPKYQLLFFFLVLQSLSLTLMNGHLTFLGLL